MVYFIISLAVISRFIPHLANFAPITALAIFSAAYLPWKKSLAITLAARLISDVFLGFFAWPLILAVYASHLIGILLGLWIKQSQHVISARFAGAIARRVGIVASAVRITAIPIAPISITSLVIAGARNGRSRILSHNFLC